MEHPVYLVQLPNGPIYAYWTKKIMNSDLKRNNETGKVKIFKKVSGLKILKYALVEADNEVN